MIFRSEVTISGNSSIIDVSEVTREFLSPDGGVSGVRGISLSVTRGSFVALSGPSGSGKTTILNLIAGLDAPNTGSVFLDGQDISRLSVEEKAALRLQKIGFIFQAYNLLPVLTALENIEFLLRVKGLPSRQAKGRAQHMLKSVGLSSHFHKRPGQLSGGQQQRVAIARALSTEPKVVLADEPTANLDSQTARSLLELMRNLNQETGTTFVFSSHDPLVLDSADRIIELRDGCVTRERYPGRI